MRSFVLRTLAKPNIGQSAGAVRSYGMTTKGPAAELRLQPRGTIPGPPNNYPLIGAAVVAIGGVYLFRQYMKNNRVDIKLRIWNEWQDNEMEIWKDFDEDNEKMPKNARVLANGACGDSFKDAFMCAVFDEGKNCGEKFQGFLECAKSNPIMTRATNPTGTMNWGSKFFLQDLIKERQYYEDLIDSVGPAEENMDDVLSDYRARHILGANATESEVQAFTAKFKSLTDEFYKEVNALFHEEKSDSSRADTLYKQLKKDFSIPNEVWLQVLKEYDVEEFDEVVSGVRLRYGRVAFKLKKMRIEDEARTANLENVACGDQFSKWYKCLGDVKDSTQCADFVDELYFCRESHYKNVWPNSSVFGTKNASYANEAERITETVSMVPFLSN